MPRPINSRVINWYRTPLSKDQIAELNQRSDFKGYLQSVGFLSLIAFSAIGTFMAWYHGYWGWMLIGFFAHATLMHFCINAIHELVHGTVFEKDVLNKTFADIFSVISWIDHQIFWASHTEHHKYTLFYPDDGEVVAPVKIDPQMTDIFKRGFINLNFYKAIYCHLKYTINVSRGKVFPSDEWHMKLFPENYPEGREQFYRIKKIQLGVHGGVLLISLLSGMWIIPLIFSFSKFFGGSWLHQLCNHAQHSGLPESIPDFRLSCRTITLSPFVQFLYWHMNFHIEHHMFAAVPCYNLKKCHDLIKNDCPKPYNGLVETWVNMINIQRKMDEDENYRHMPELPTEANPARMKELESNTPLYDVDGITPLQKSTPPGDASFKIWECSVCAFIYDEARGLPEEGLAPGTRWDDIPDDWECPDCGVAKSKFKMIEVAAQPIDSTNILE